MRIQERFILRETSPAKWTIRVGGDILKYTAFIQYAKVHALLRTAPQPTLTFQTCIRLEAGHWRRMLIIYKPFVWAHSFCCWGHQTSSTSNSFSDTNFLKCQLDCEEPCFRVLTFFFNMVQLGQPFLPGHLLSICSGSPASWSPLPSFMILTITDAITSNNARYSPG